MFERLVHLSLRQSPLLHLQVLQLAARVQAIHLRIVQRDVHLLHTPHVWRDIDVEAVRHERPTRVCAGEKVIAPSGSVVSAPSGDIVDGAVDGEEDGLIGVGITAVVGFQICICVLLWSGLCICFSK